ncbi:dienelactone hydrolase family protein [Agarivorans gilvus]|nr:alpha/beta fold hydrolase [Agarivorans gilvus]
MYFQLGINDAQWHNVNQWPSPLYSDKDNNTMIIRATIIFIALLSSAAQANEQGENISLTMTESGLLWDKQIQLQATLYKPDGKGPFPLVIFNHGSTGPGQIPASLTINPWQFGRYLKQQNIALLVPMRRGRGGSQGSYKESYNCSVNSVEAGINYASQSLDATMHYVQQQTWIDQDQIVIAGHSRGGLLSVLYAAKHPQWFKGVLNFSGGWMAEQCQITSPTASNLGLFTKAAHNNPLPHLFLYAHNDPYYSDATITSYVQSFKQAGGQVDFQFYSLGSSADGHALFHEYGEFWINDVKRYLQQLGLI